MTAIADWDELHAPGTPYAASWWFRDSEAIYDRLPRTYVTVRDGGRLLAATACWTVGQPQILLPPLESTRLFMRWQCDAGNLEKRYVGPWAQEQLFPYTLCGSPRGYHGTLHLRDGLDETTRWIALRRLFEGAADVARAAGSRLLLWPLLGYEDKVSAVSAMPSLLAVHGLTDCWLAPVPTFDDYLAAFHGHRRERIRRDTRGFDAEGLRVEVRPISEVADELGRLLAADRVKHGWQTDPTYDAEALAIAAQRRGATTRAFCALRGNELVGVVSCVCDNGVYSAFAGGVAPDEPKRGAHYFNLLYYAPIREAVKDGVTKIHYGGGSLDVKYRRGCRSFAQLWNVVLPLTEWSSDARHLIQDCGTSLLDLERGMLAPFVEIDQLDGMLPRAPARIA